MIQTVFSAALPVGERLVIRKNRIGRTHTGPRISVVTGTHGDELEGQFVAFELARRLQERPSDLSGTIDIYPALNPLGLSAHERGIPHYDIDLDRTFPGSTDGSLTEALADAVLSDILGSNVCVDIHSSSVLVEEVTQVQVIKDGAGALTRLASLMNARLVYEKNMTTGAQMSLSQALYRERVPTLLVYMGAGMRLNEDAGTWVVEGILRLLEHLGAWSGPTIALPAPHVTDGSNVRSVSADVAGIFLPRAKHGARVSTGQTIGLICDPLAGTVKHEVTSPAGGLLFTLRTYPVVYPGSLLARVLEV